LLVHNIDTTVAAPLEPAESGMFADRLNPRVGIDGKVFALITQELVTVRKSVLGQTCGSIAAERDAVIAALDLLFTGF
jgi:toxin CcdB